MLKKIRRLKLNRETLRHLSEEGLRVAGGGTLGGCYTNATQCEFSVCVSECTACPSNICNKSFRCG